MHSYLTRLNIKPAVQLFFDPYYQTDSSGDLLFTYGEVREHFGLAFHRIPVSNKFWIGGNHQFTQIRQVIICSSAMEALSWLNNNYNSFASTDNLLFLATGAGIFPQHIRFINERLNGKTFALLYGGDLLGRIAGLKIAAGIRRMPVVIYLQPDEVVRITFRSGVYEFAQDEFSLPAFERAAKFRFNIPALLPKGHESFFDLLKANANLNF